MRSGTGYFTGYYAWTPKGDEFGDAITEYPTVWFFDEFLCRPNVSKWQVDRPKVKHVETGRVWILTGEYDLERNMYEARWPD